MLSYFPNHSKHSKTTKVLKSQWIVSIWRQNDQKCWVTFKPFQTQQNYKSDQITMNCIDLTSKRSKMLSYVSNYSKHRKTTKVHRFDVKTIKNVELRPKPFQTQQNKSAQITMNCNDMMSKRSKIFSYVQTIPNTAKQKWSNYDELHRFDVKTIKNVELRPKPFQTQQNKSAQITMNCNDMMSKRSKIFSYVQTIPNTAKQKCSNHDELQRFDVKTIKNFQLRSNHSKHSKTKVIKLRWIASIRRPNDKKCWVTSQTIPNTAKLEKWSNHDEFHRFDV